MGRNPYAPLATGNRGAKYRAPIAYNPQSAKGWRFVENTSQGLRVQSAEDIFRAKGWRRESTGWYVDNHAGETTNACVVALPGKNGAPRYCAGTSDPWNTGAHIVDFGTVYDAPEDAARGACSLAERFSEECREDAMQQSALFDIETALDEIREARAEHSAMIRARVDFENCNPVVDFRKFANDTTRAQALDAMAQVCARARADCSAAVKVIRARRDNPATTLPGY